MSADITNKFLRMLLSSYYMKTFRFPTKASKRSKWLLADSTKRVFQNCSMKIKVQLCEMNAHITKKFVRMLLSCSYVKIFNFPWSASKHSNYPLSYSTKKVFQTAQSKVRFNSVRWMHVSQRQFSECFWLVFMWRYYLFHHRPQSTTNVRLQILQRVSWLFNQKKSSTLWHECTYHKEVSQNASV